MSAGISMEYLCVVSAMAMVASFHIIPTFQEMFIKAGLFGVDLNKKEKKKIPEATGAITGCLFLITTIVMIPMTYLGIPKEDFPYLEFIQLLSALLSISCMLLLGFADDVLDLQWRHRLLLPSLASLPLLIVYYVTTDRTEVVVPIVLRPLLGTNLDIGKLYYVYMGMLAVFCTNAINIMAGINGLETGQSVVIAASIALFNLGEINGPLGHYHRFSVYFLFPYLATTIPLLYYNWYPSAIFNGDTFNYFSGMTLAVVAILGHFSKTLLLFFIPQIFNFVYSLPQLFRLIPCPRHRLPKYNPDTDKVGMSFTEFKSKDLKPLGRLCLFILQTLRFVHYKEFTKDGEEFIQCNNLTIINLMLLFAGPIHEASATKYLMVVQMLCSLVAFVIRYPLAFLFYGEIIA